MTHIANWKVFVSSLFFAGAGTLYIVNSPQIVTSLTTIWGFSNQQAGLATTMQTLGSLLGMMVMLIGIETIKLRKWIVGSLLVTAVCEGLVAFYHTPELFIAIRLIAGIAAGMLLAAGLALIGYLPHTERLFAISLITAFISVGITTYYWTTIIGAIGLDGIFIAVALFALAYIVMYRWIPETTAPYIEAKTSSAATSYTMKDLLQPAALLTIASFVLFYAGNMAIWTFSSQIGMALGMDFTQTTETITYTLIAGFIASIIAAVLGMRIGYAISFIVGLGGIAVSTWLMFDITDQGSFFYAFALFNFCFSFAIPYYQGLQARMDPTGRLVIAGLVASQAGLTLGPALSTALVAEDSSFAPLYWLSLGCFVLSLMLILIVVRQQKNNTEAQAVSPEQPA